jgi:hypothetical protein
MPSEKHSAKKRNSLMPLNDTPLKILFDLEKETSQVSLIATKRRKSKSEKHANTKKSAAKPKVPKSTRKRMPVVPVSELNQPKPKQKPSMWLILLIAVWIISVVLCFLGIISFNSRSPDGAMLVALGLTSSFHAAISFLKGLARN